jgi:pyruvate kinase
MSPATTSFTHSQRSALSHNAALRYDSTSKGTIRMNNIICTIGPKTQTVEAMKSLIVSGMQVVRMNMSHGSMEWHLQTILNARQAAEELNVRALAIALDTKGPEIRTGLMADPNGIKLEAGKTVLVTCDEEFSTKGTAEKFYIDYPRFVDATKVGGKIYIDDGVLDLTIEEKLDAKTVRCRINNNHVLTNRKGTNLPQANVDLPAVSDLDRQHLEFGAKHKVDMIFASFIRNAQQVRDVRACLGDRASETLVFAKIENHQGVDNIDSIIDESDGIMVARGDLGVEIPAERVFVAQKMLIARCNMAGKPVICATQMLESMTTNPRPTRAEVSDVANAVLDGADCVMLSGETAKGAYPCETVRYMVRICVQAQLATDPEVVYNNIRRSQPTPMDPEEGICCSAVATAQEVGASVIVVLSNTGRSARFLAKYRPACPIICVSQKPDLLRKLTVVRGVFPVYYDVALLGEDPTRDRRVQLGVKYAQEILQCCDEGTPVLAVHADFTSKKTHFANCLRVNAAPAKVDLGVAGSSAAELFEARETRAALVVEAQ